MRRDTVFNQRLRTRPLPLTTRPWRAGAYVALRLPLPLTAVAALALAAASDSLLIGAAVVLLVLVAYVALAIAVASTERRLVAMIGGSPQPVADPHVEPEGQTRLAAIRARLREEATAREAAYGLVRLALALIDCLLLVALCLGAPVLILAPALAGSGEIALGPWSIGSQGAARAAVPIGIVLLIVGTYALVGLGAVHVALARTLLAPRGAELDRQMTELTRSRVRLIDAFDVERRRIERDLHDGAQQQLVTLAMTLDLARIELEGHESREAARLVSEAHAQITRTIGELRDLVNGIHPPALADRGLPGAIAELVDRALLPIAERVDLPDRLPESVETAAYFVLSEALTNAAKHSHATHVEIDVHLRGDDLALTVRDDGVGGADAGSGLAGLGDRVAALGGRLTLSSPLGGPTVLQATIPCRGTTR